MWHIVKQETDGEREGHEKLGHVAGPDTRVPYTSPFSAVKGPINILITGASFLLHLLGRGNLLHRLKQLLRSNGRKVGG